MLDQRAKQLSGTDIEELTRQFDELWQNEHDIRTAHNSGRLEGYSEGLSKGLDEGLVQGRNEERSDTLKTMIQNGFSEELILKAGYTQIEINNTKSLIER